jgi:hypothetical protein
MPEERNNLPMPDKNYSTFFLDPEFPDKYSGVKLPVATYIAHQGKILSFESGKNIRVAFPVSALQTNSVRCDLIRHFPAGASLSRHSTYSSLPQVQGVSAHLHLRRWPPSCSLRGMEIPGSWKPARAKNDVFVHGWACGVA